MAAKILRSYLQISRYRRVITHKPLVPSLILPRQDNCLAYPRIAPKPRLDLTQLYPEAPDLYLEVIAPQKLYIAVW
jgi:hypothetical protein